MIIKTNYNLDELFCVCCKSRINIGEKFVVNTETYYGETIKKEYHLDCAPTEEDDEETFFNC